MNLEQLRKVNLSSIRAAGPRYSPAVDPHAPNLEIGSLVSAIESLSLGDNYRARVNALQQNLTNAWKGSPVTTKAVLGNSLPKRLIRKLDDLLKQRPGKSALTLNLIQKYSIIASSILQKERDLLWEKEQATEEHSQERRDIHSSIESLRTLNSAVQQINSLTETQDFDLISNNRMILLGDWGTGKTHTLCDITISKMAKRLPTLLLLAHELPSDLNPLQSICVKTKLAHTPTKLLVGLSRLGKAAGVRSLLIIDGINEADRKTWKRFLPAVISLLKRYQNVGLILSCRRPFERHILTDSLRKGLVEVNHNGFQKIELDAQRIFFKYYNIPDPHIPLLTPEFSRPLFLKILCKTFSGKTSRTKSRWLREVAAGQKTMTKLFEDFVKEIGSKIEREFDLAGGTCWRILKGHKTDSGDFIGLAPRMAEQVLDYIQPTECFSIIKLSTSKQDNVVQLIFRKMITEGLLLEDTVWKDGSPMDVVRFPYQRFSDHLISRHLLNQYLNTSSQAAIRHSFYKNRPLGKIFELPPHHMSYRMPGLASAIMLEFPERVKNTVGHSETELVYYLPRRNRLLRPLVETFLDGILWRSKDSFSRQTDLIVSTLLQKDDSRTKDRVLEVLVSLACRPSHPYSAQRLHRFLSAKKVVERDLLWSEFLRKAEGESVIIRLLNWIDDTDRSKIDVTTAESVILLTSMFLTTTNRGLRDRATRILVLIGENQPRTLFEKAIESLSLNDPYVPERMLASCYGVMMRCWAFPSKELKACTRTFAENLYDSMFAISARYSTNHILSRDYALGILKLALKVDRSYLGSRPLENLQRPYKPGAVRIPNPRSITERYCKSADPAIHMDFGNYTIGHLASNRRNYDYKNLEYRGILRQVKWRILNLGYDEELFKDIDRSIGSANFYREQSEKSIKVDRYGKKYSWIGYFEVAGMLENQGALPEWDNPRISECDIDPSFPESLKVWQPELENFFAGRFTSARSWALNGGSPSYDHLLNLEQIDKLRGPWVLLAGYIGESSKRDPRGVFTFINGLLVREKDLRNLHYKFNSRSYPGNRQIPEPGEDYYTFAGEIPWSNNFGAGYYKPGKTKRHVAECFEDHETYTVRKKVSNLSKSELFTIMPPLIQFFQTQTTQEEAAELSTKVEPPPKFVTLTRSKKIPGVRVEVPVHRLAWESYHSSENQGGGAVFPAPALCDYLHLKNRSNHQDLFDVRGNRASIFRIFGDKSDYFRSRVFYIRRDLLKKYLVHTHQKLVWFIWGEREMKSNVLEASRGELQDIWSLYRHIHKKMKVARIK